MRRIVLFLSLLVVVNAAQPTRPVSHAGFERWFQELSNWGRWGKNDELGALNLITPAKRKQAAALVQEGFAVSLAHDIIKEKTADNKVPFVATMVSGAGSPDEIIMDAYQFPFHGTANTHLDGLGHVAHHGQLYNGFSAQAEVTANGLRKLAVLNMKNGVMTRGILLDIARLKGVDYLEPGTAIYPEDLDAWEKRAGVKVSPGDVVLIRTGRWARRQAKGPWALAGNTAGLHASTAKWLHDRDVAMVGSDGSLEVGPSQVEGEPFPMHRLLLAAMGVPLLDSCDLEALGQAAAQRKRWAFLITVDPLAVPGGTGGLINPVATF